MGQPGPRGEKRDRKGCKGARCKREARGWELLLMLLSLSFAFWLSLVLTGLALSDCGCLSCKPVCQAWKTSTPGRPVLSGRNLGMESCGTGSALGCRQKPEGSCPQLILGSCVLMALGGSLLGQEFEQKWWCYLCSKAFGTPGRPALSLRYLSMERCGTGSAPEILFHCIKVSFSL